MKTATLRAPCFTPALESLEERCCPASAVMRIEYVDNTLNVYGNNTSNTVKFVLGYDGQGSVLAQISGIKGAMSVIADDINLIRFFGGTGGDRIQVTQGMPLKTPLRFDLNLGNGSNQVDLGFQAGIGGYKVDLNVEGGTAKDKVTLTVGELMNTTLNVTGNLRGTGNSFTSIFTGALRGSTSVTLNVTAGANGDTLALQANNVFISPSAVLQANFVGGAGNDRFSMDYLGQLQGRLILKSDGGMGSDVMAANITAAAQSTGKITTELKGGNGAGNDDLTVKLIDNSGQTAGGMVGGSLLTSRSFKVDGGAGFDTLHRNFNFTDILNCEKLDPAVIPL